MFTQGFFSHLGHTKDLFLEVISLIFTPTSSKLFSEIFFLNYSGFHYQMHLEPVKTLTKNLGRKCHKGTQHTYKVLCPLGVMQK